MDRRRAAGALLALTACIACSAAAPTASNHTALDLYEGASEGCYYNFQHYGEGDRIMTNEPCLNCTCHNRMLMCYLRVCPFTKPIGQDCSVEKRADQCCPIVTCPDVPVDLLTSTSTSSPAEYGATGLGKLDKYGCSISGKYFPEGSKVPPTPNKPCEHCYCIRNMTTCVMQECTLHVDGCTPIYHKDVCCPVRYSCDHPEDEIPLLDDMSTTVRPTPGFLLTTTTLSPVTQMTQDCVHNDQVIADGASITTEKACEHCYCMKGDIVCVVQECGAPMENEGKNCTSLPPREGQCCPDTYICEGDDLSSEISTDSTTDSILEKLTTLSPPRRTSVEGSGYRNEPSEGVYTEPSTEEPELEGSGEEHESTLTTGSYKPIITDKPAEHDEMSPDSEDAQQYIPVTTKAPFVKIPETTTKQVEPDIYQPYSPVHEDVQRSTTEIPDEEYLKPHKHVTIASTFTPESDKKITTDSGQSLNTVPYISPEQEHEKPHEHYISATGTTPTVEDSSNTTPQYEETKGTPAGVEQDEKNNSITEFEHLATSPGVTDDIAIETTERPIADLTEKESTEPGRLGETTGAPVTAESETHAPKETDVATSGDILTDKESPKPDFDHSTTSSSVSGSTELDNALNTVAVNEEGYIYPRPISEEADKLTSSDEGVTGTEKITKYDSTESLIYTTTPVLVQAEKEKTTEPDKGLNTIPNEIDDESSSPSSSDKTGFSSETKSPETSVIVDVTEPQELDIISSESLPASSEGHVTKADQYTITTEPSFRREDEAAITTEKLKEEPVQTTIKPEFIDEGLIPTSTHDEKLNTGFDVSIMEEDITTVIPEDVKETVDSQKPMTESSVTFESLPEKITESSPEQEGELTTSTDKSVDVITLPAEIDHHEEQSRIPGEGDCLLSGVTYRNNTIVPSSNNCHTGCKCVSSIIKCDPIICMPPPDHMDNCQTIYDTSDSCCPTYVCDHPKETIPPQSDNQMSGTEPPSPHPVIECRGDQCELSESTKVPTESYKPCTSSDCLPTVDHKPQDSECGPEGCVGIKETSFSQQPGEKVECTDEKCKPAELPPTHSQISPMKPCDGDDCKEFGEDKPTPQLCENENDCKKIDLPVTQTVSCEGDSCKNIDCGGGGCDHNVPSQDNLHSLCREEDGCKPEETIPSDCTGDLPCRRKEIPSAEVLPSKCEGVVCAQKTDTPVSQLGTESLPEEAPETTEKIDRKPVQDFPTEGPILIDDVEIDTKKPDIVVTEHTDIPSSVVEKGTEIPDIIGKPVFDKEQGIKDSVVIKEDHTDKTILSEEEGTKIPDFEEGQTDKPGMYETESTKIVEEGTKSPKITEEYTHKPALDEEEGTQVPEVVEQQTAKPNLVDAESTKMPEVSEERTDKPDLVEEASTKVPVTTEQITAKPESDETKRTKIPEVTEEHTSKQDLVEEEATKIPDFTDKHTDKPILVENESTKQPDMFEKHTKMPVEEYTSILPDIIEEHTDKVMPEKEDKTIEPNVIDELTTKIALLDEGSTRLPYNEGEPTDNPIFIEKEETKSTGISGESTNKPALAEEEGTKIPAFAEGQTDKPGIVETESTKTLDITEVYTNKPVLVKEESTKGPEIIEAHTHKPALDEEEGTKVSEAADEQTDKPSLFERASTKIPDVTEEQTYKPESITDNTDVPVLLEETATKTPYIADEYTNKPAVIDDVGSVITDIKKDNTDKTISIEPEVVTDTTILPEDESKEKPILVDEDLPEKPFVIKGDSEKKPDLIDIESTSEPAIFETESSVYPQEIERSTKRPVLIDEDSTAFDIQITDKPTTIGEQVSIIKEDTKVPVVDYTDQPIALVDKGTETSEQPEHYPQTPSDQDTRRTEEPEMEAASKSPVEEHTETVHTELKPVTKSPSDEQQTTFEIDSHVLDDKFGHEDEPKPDEQPTGVKEPTLVSEPEYAEISTKLPLSETIPYGTLPPSKDQGTYPTSEYSTTSQEPETGSAESKKPVLTVTTESTEKITKSSEPETITEGEIYTDMPDQEPSITKSPEEIIIEPQEGRPSESPESPVSEVVVDETTAKVFEEHSTLVVPESHVTESIQYESSSPITEPETPKVTDLPEVVDSKIQEIGVSEPHKPEPEVTPTPSVGLTDLTKDDFKTDQPEILTSEKEEMITGTVISQVTEPVKEFTETNDSLVTTRHDSTTKYYGETTERLEPTATEKFDESSEIAITSSEISIISDSTTTKETVLSYTKAHEEQTESPELKESKPIDSDVSSATTTESSEQTEPSKPTTGYQDQPTKILTTVPPVFKVTEAKEKPDVSVNDKTSQKEKTTATPETGNPSTPEEQTVTKISNDYVTESEQPEKPISIEPELIDIPKTTALPEIVEQPEVTEAPELQHTVAHDTDLKLHPAEDQKSSTEYSTTFDETRTELSPTKISTEPSMSLVTESNPDVSISKDSSTEKQVTEPTLHEAHTESHEQITNKLEDAVVVPDETTPEQLEDVTKSADQTTAKTEFSETTPYLIELEEHTHKIVEEVSMASPSDADITTPLLIEEDHTPKSQEPASTASPSVDYTHKLPEDELMTVQTEGALQGSEAATEKKPEEDIDTVTKQVEFPDESTYQPTESIPEEESVKMPEVSSSIEPDQTEKTTALPPVHDKLDVDQTDITTSKLSQDSEGTTPTALTVTEKSPISELDIVVPIEKETSATEKPLHPTEASRRTTVPEEEIILSTTIATPVKEEVSTSVPEDKYSKPEEKPTSEAVPPTAAADISKPPTEMQPTDETTPDEGGHFPETGYGEPDYVEEDQAFGPGTCRYGGKVYVSAQQIPRDDPCDFCFCFRSDIICLQQSCPPPIHGCHEEPIQGFCCPRYECPVSMATTVNVTTTTTTTTTTLPPHFPTHSYKGAAQRRGCQIKGHTYKVGEVVRSSSGPCLHCTCGGDGQMKCDPKACTPEPMLRQMIAAAVSAKRRR